MSERSPAPAPSTPSASASAIGKPDVDDGRGRWLTAWLVYSEPASWRMLLLGFSAGLPNVLLVGTLSFWLREAGVDRTTIGFLSWITFASAVKFAWAPLVDRVPLPWLTVRIGRFRSWLLLSQLIVIAGLLGMAVSDPGSKLWTLVGFAMLAAFGSATQDIALDAYRIESAGLERQAALAAMYQTGYRLAMIWSGAGALALAAAFSETVAPTASAAAGATAVYRFDSWRFAYASMAASMLVGVIAVLLSPEPAPGAARERPGPRAPMRDWPSQLGRAIATPFVDFFIRYRWHALLLLAIVALYKLSDVVMGRMANTFYVDMGYTKAEVATISKIYGVVMTLAGSFLGGILVIRFGLARTLILGAISAAATNLLFAWLAARGHDPIALIGVISADNLASGIASSAFIAYLSGLTNTGYTATQYALFSSLMQLLPQAVAGFSGKFVDLFDYSAFFIGTALLGVPVLVLIVLATRVRGLMPHPTDAAPPRR